MLKHSSLISSFTGNIWALTHNPTTYPNPSVFDPTRYLGPHPQPDPRNVAFGFGRRVCSGQHIAENTVWIQMVLALATVHIAKCVDAEGQVIEPEMAVTTGIVR
jgi:cytochrome P450